MEQEQTTDPTTPENTSQEPEVKPQSAPESNPVINPDDRPIGGAKPNNMDEVPIGGGSKFNFTQYPDENAPIKPKKPVAKKAPLKQKKQQEKNTQNLPTQSLQTTVQPKVVPKRASTRVSEPTETSPADERPIGGGMTSGFDEQPIGRGNFKISQFPEDGPPPDDAPPAQLPLEQRVKSKAIKAKMSAFQQLTGMIESGDLSIAESVQFSQLLKQSNPGCLQKILICFQKYVQKDGRWGDQQIKVLVESGYINGKGTSKKVAWQILDYLYEKKPQTIEMAIVGGLKGKTMKTVAGFITLINQLLSTYGIKKMHFLKAYYPDVIKLISNEKLPLLKTQGTTMLKEAMKWLTKDFLQPYFKQHSLKEGIKKQLDQFWDQYDKNAVMTAPKADVQPPSKAVGGKAGKIDVYNFSQAVDIFKKFNQKWASDVLKTQKWNQKTKLMMDFVTAAGVPKLANTDFRHIIDLIKRLIGDANMNVVLTTLKIAAVMAQGLRKHFSPYAKMFFGNIIQKFKDKKTQMIDQTNKCLNQFSYCLSIQDVLQDIKQGLNDKNPNMKVNIMIWIERVLDRKAIENSGEIPAKLREAVKGLFPILEKLCNDGAVNVRDITVKVIAKARALIGQQFFAPLESKLGKVIVGKIDSIIVDVPERPATAQQKQKQQSIAMSQTIRPQTSNVHPLSKTMNLQSEKSAQKTEVNQVYEKPPLKGNMKKQDQQKPIDKSIPKFNERSMQKIELQPSQRVGLYNGDTIMPEAKFLSSYRIARQQGQQSSPWNFDNISQAKQEQLMLDIGKSFRKDLSSRMLAINYKKVQEASNQISRLCKDLSQQACLRQVSDVILKWILYRLFGGNPPLAMSLMEIVPQILAILQKRNLIISESDVLLVVSIFREFSISNIDLNVKLPQFVNTTIRALVKLHSGDRILKVILKQYQVQLHTIHKHLRKQSTMIYRECLNRIIKHNLVDFVGTQEILTTLSQIRQISKDPEFIEILYSRFNESALNAYGFNKQPYLRTPHRHAEHSPNSSALQNNQHSTSQTKHVQNKSGLLQPPPLHPQQQGSKHPNMVKHSSGGTNNSIHMTPTNNLPTTVSASNLYASRGGGSQSNLTPQVHQRSLTPPLQQNFGIQQEIPLINKINLSNYPCPHPSNPLNEHLSKLNPPTDTTLQFFTALFTQNSERIATQLQDYAKIILGAILKSNIDIIDRRNSLPPEKIAAQLSLLQQALKNKSIIRNAGEVLSLCTQFVLKQLVYQDENKVAISDAIRERGFDYKVQNFIKIINGIMLRILQNGHPHQVTITLFDYLIQCLKRPVVSQKTLSLVLKCINRVANSYVNELQQSNLKELFLKFHQYNTELEGRLKPDDQGLQIIRNLLTQIAKQVKQNIWNSYEKAMAETHIQDQFIINHFNNLKIPYPEKPQYSEKEEELKKISEMLSKIRTYDSGIKLLNSFLEQYPDFQIAKYFADLNYEPKFINKVLNTLQTNFNKTIQPQMAESRRSEERRQRSLQRSHQDINIQHRIKNLRQRFDQIQVTRVQDPPQHKEDDVDPDRANQIRRRITQMKAKIHNVIK